ncbi:MAG: hypothetical protein A2X23_05345 [Chloroflexi bacterium GWC2_73_18]|nr:MAG: hypothetical protein A2X23_05345 [Chloroflexi bacterium GWC2_73_18]
MTAPTRWAAAGAVAGLVGLALVRIALFGWAGAAPDDARYLYVGLSVLDGHGPVTPDGRTFLLRSPVYGLLLATGGRVMGGDPLEGAHLAASAFALAGLVGAAYLGWRLGGPAVGIGTAIALAAAPLVWGLLPTLRVDLVQTAGVVAVLAALLRPEAWRWALAGAILGLTVLVKESVLLLLVLPIAWLRPLPIGRWLRLTAVYLALATAVAAWWWIVVWIDAGVVFPLNGLAVIEAREVAATPLRLRDAALLAVALGAWAAVLARARHEIGPRLLVVAAACLVPPAAYALLNGLSARNYAGLTVLSAVALALAGVDLLRWLLRWTSARPAGRRGAWLAAGAGLAVLTGIVALGQVLAERPERFDAPRQVAAWLAPRVEPGDRVVMTFRDRESVAVELYGQVTVAGLPVSRVAPDDPAEGYVWIGLRDEQLFGYRRDAWRQALARPRTRFLVLVEPHPLTPGELLPLLRSGAAPSFGLRPAATLAVAETVVEILEVEPAALSVDGDAIPLHLSAAAAEAWLDAAAGATAEPTAITRLVGARPVVVGSVDALDRLLARLGEAVCRQPAEAPSGEAALRLAPPDDSGACPEG